MPVLAGDEPPSSSWAEGRRRRFAPAGYPGGEGCEARPWLPGLTRWPILPSCAGVGEQTQGQAPRSAPQDAAVESQARGSGFGTLREETGSSLGAPSCRAWEPGSSRFLPQLFGARAKASSGDRAPLHQKSPPLLEHSGRGVRGPGRDCAVGVLALDPILCHILPWFLPSAPACLCSERGLNSPSKVKIPPTPRLIPAPPPSRSPGAPAPGGEGAARCPVAGVCRLLAAFPQWWQSPSGILPLVKLRFRVS